jgi:hypothetical protein
MGLKATHLYQLFMTVNTLNKNQKLKPKLNVT